MRTSVDETLKRLSRLMLMVAVSARISVFGQQVNPGFEVASIKLHIANSGSHDASCTNGRFISAGLPLWTVIAWAYELKDDAFQEFSRHLPSIGRSYYDIQAEAERPVVESQCRLLTQTLLADRFKFAAHWESRDAEIDDLVFAPSGPKIQRASDDDKGVVVNIVVDGRPLSRPPAPGPEPKGLTMQELAKFLTSRRTLQPIVDKTGLEGRYKIDLRYSTKVPISDQDVLDPDLEAALVKQLGLRLEKHKGMVDVFVVDHIEPPTPN